MKKIDELQARYPLVPVEEKETILRLKTSRTSADNVSKDNPDLEKIMEYYNLKIATQNWLEALYPYLYFSIGDIAGYTNPQQAEWAKNFRPQSCGVWLRRLCDWGDHMETIDGTATGFEFMFPPDEKTTKKLKELNEEAKKAQEDGYFFCSVCQKAYPKSEYGGFYFAEKRCKKCATPEWKAEAARETYN